MLYFLSHYHLHDVVKVCVFDIWRDSHFLRYRWQQRRFAQFDLWGFKILFYLMSCLFHMAIVVSLRLFDFCLECSMRLYWRVILSCVPCMNNSLVLSQICLSFYRRRAPVGFRRHHCRMVNITSSCLKSLIEQIFSPLNRPGGSQRS